MRVFAAFLAALVLCVPSYADEVDDALKGLEKAIKEKSRVDMVHFVQTLGDKYGAATAPQKKEIVKLTEKVLNVAKEQEPKDAAVEALSKMDAAALTTLTKEFEKKTTEENATFQSNLVLAMGKLKDEKTGLPYLRKLLKHKSIDVVASAGEALSNYKDVALPLRKEIANDILGIWGGVASAARKPTDTSSKKKLERLDGPMGQSLKILTNADPKPANNEQLAVAWQKWWNDSGKKADKW